MPSSLTWMDYSEDERQQVLDIVRLFTKEEDTRDELGIGTVRDAFSNALYPGTSVIQTRARYFLFVPWMYRELELRRIASSKIGDYARRREIALIEALSASDDTHGLIGIDAGAKLQRMPSDIYWQGLKRWGIHLLPSSRSDYHRYLDSFYAADPEKNPTVRTDDGDPAEGQALANWHPGLPEPPDNFPSEASFALKPSEAQYLCDRVLAAAPGSLLAVLLSTTSRPFMGEFPWQHPELARFPSQVQGLLRHAHNFSQAIFGAALLYNLMLAEESESDSRRQEFRQRLEDWWHDMQSRSWQFINWDRGEFWFAVEEGSASIPGRTRSFVNSWLDMVMGWVREEVWPDYVIAHRAARTLVQHRERALKGSRARLGNRRALELWRGSSGAYRLDYRWSTVRTIVRDILDGLGEVM